MSQHVIFDVDTLKVFATSNSKSGASRMMPRIMNQYPNHGFRIATADQLSAERSVAAPVTVINLQSGKPVQLMPWEEGTCVDPSTERYWSM